MSPDPIPERQGVAPQDSTSSDCLTRRDINLLTTYAAAPWMDETQLGYIKGELSPFGRGVLGDLIVLSSSGLQNNPTPNAARDRYYEDALFFWDWAKQAM